MSKRSINDAIYYNKHREKILKRVSKYQQNNKEKVSNYHKKYYKINKSKVKSAKRTHYLDNKSAIKEKQRWSSIKHLYSINKQDYNAILYKQNYKCGLCGLNFNKETPHIDHCHSTGKVRGLLHRKCNSFIGMANDDPRLLHLGIVYLERINT